MQISGFSWKWEYLAPGSHLPTRWTIGWHECDCSLRGTEVPTIPHCLHPPPPTFLQPGISLALGTFEFAIRVVSILCGSCKHEHLLVSRVSLHVSCHCSEDLWEQGPCLLALVTPGPSTRQVHHNFLMKQTSETKLTMEQALNEVGEPGLEL